MNVSQVVDIILNDDSDRNVGSSKLMSRKRS